MAHSSKKKIQDMTNEEVLALFQDPDRKWYDMKNPKDREQFYKDTVSPFRPKK